MTARALSGVNFEVRAYHDADEPAVLELLGAAFERWPGPGTLDALGPAEHFRWKHACNPHGPSEIFLAEADERIIAMRAYMPWALTGAAGEPLPSNQAVDLVTHPDFRGKGVGWALVKYAIERFTAGAALNLGLPNDASIAQSTKAGWRALEPFPVWVQVRRPLRVVRRAHSLKRPADGSPPPPIEAATACQLLSEVGDIRELQQDLGDTARLSADRDFAYLRWRYATMLADYRSVAEFEGDRLCGLAIFRVRPRGKLWEACVSELLARPGDHKTVRRLTQGIARSAAVDYVAALPVGGSTLASSLARAGFAPSPVGAMPMGVFAFTQVTPDPFVGSSWALSLGDLERLQLC